MSDFLLILLILNKTKSPNFFSFPLPYTIAPAPLHPPFPSLVFLLPLSHLIPYCSRPTAHCQRKPPSADIERVHELQGLAEEAAVHSLHH